LYERYLSAQIDDISLLPPGVKPPPLHIDFGHRVPHLEEPVSWHGGQVHFQQVQPLQAPDIINQTLQTFAANSDNGTETEIQMYSIQLKLQPNLKEKVWFST